METLISFPLLELACYSAMDTCQKSLEQWGYVTPILHLFYPNGKDEIFGFKGFPEDVNPASFIGTLIQSKGAGAYLFLNEAWQYEPSAEEIENYKRTGTFVRAGAHPNRKECIVVIAEHPKGSVSLNRKFHKENEKIVYDSEVERVRLDKACRFANLLRPQG